MEFPVSDPQPVPTQPLPSLPEVEPLMVVEQVGEPAPAPAPRAPDPDSIDDLRAVFDVPVKVQAVLGRAKMPIGELLSLRAGMVVDLDRRVGEAVDVLVNDRLIARGEVVLVDDQLGVTLTEIVRPER